jgi:hypothetical protein
MATVLILKNNFRVVLDSTKMRDRVCVNEREREIEEGRRRGKERERKRGRLKGEILFMLYVR